MVTDSPPLWSDSEGLLALGAYMTPYELDCLAQVRPYGDAQAILRSGVLPNPWYTTASGRNMSAMSSEHSKRSHTNMWFQAHGLIAITTDPETRKQITTWSSKGLEYLERIKAANLDALPHHEQYQAFPEMQRTVFPQHVLETWLKDPRTTRMIKYFDFA